MANKSLDTRGKKMGRPKTGQGRLTRDRILEAALWIVDDDGLEALNMRRLGAELGVDPMSIYRHVSSKEVIVSGLVEMVFGRMNSTPASEGSAWQLQVRAWVECYLDLARSHPNLVLRIVADAAAVSDAMLQVSEPLYSALSASGLPLPKIALAAGTVVDFVHGHALTEGSSSITDDIGFERVLLARLEAQPDEHSPTMRRVFRALAEQSTRQDPTSSFHGSLDILLKGIEAIADHPDAGG